MTQQMAYAELQMQVQQSQAAQLAHTDALRALPESAQQENFDHIFARIPVFAGTNEEDFFWMVERLQVASLPIQRDIHNEALDKVEGNIRTCLMDPPWISSGAHCHKCSSSVPPVCLLQPMLQLVYMPSFKSQMNHYISRCMTTVYYIMLPPIIQLMTIMPWGCITLWPVSIICLTSIISLTR